MRLTKHRRRQIDINMTPMIDVVFQLLIFFMSCTTVSEANKEQLDLPKLKGTEDQAKSELIININVAGELLVSGEVVTLPELVTMCSDEAQRIYDGDANRLTVVVRCDRSAASKPVNEVVAALTKLGITRVRLAVQSGDP